MNSANYFRLRCAEYRANASAARRTMRAAALRLRLAVEMSDAAEAIHARTLAIFYRRHAHDYQRMADNLGKEAA